MKSDAAKIVRVFALLSVFVAAALAMSGFAYLAAGFAAVAMLTAFANFANWILFRDHIHSSPEKPRDKTSE